MTREQPANTSGIYFDTSRVIEPQTTVVAPMSALRMLLLESAKALHKLRDTAAVREKLLSLIFSITPADRAAIVIDDSLWGGERDHSKKRVPVIRSIVDRALKEGNALLSCEPPSSIICVPLEGSDNRMGVIYAEAVKPDVPLNNIHLNILEGVAAIIAFQNAWHVEQLRAENSRLQHDLNLQRDLIGDTPAMAELANVIANAGPTNSTVLIQGETGTGKELVARGHSSQQQAIRRAFRCY